MASVNPRNSNNLARSLQDQFNALQQRNNSLIASQLQASPSQANYILSQFGSNKLGNLAQQKTPMNNLPPPKFEEGQRVTVRGGKTVYVVQRFDKRQNPYSASGYDRFYFLFDEERNRAIVEDEVQLKPAGDATGKADVDFDTVIIEDGKRKQILEALEQVNQADLIFREWGFGKTIEKGKGVSMLFYGLPGTGKTLMAQAIANKLGYKLSVIASADIESSAPGQAERNIRQHFKDAKGAKNILLFDECDSLIYTRQHVGAIMGAQINELLSQIERFDGITIFTTNRLGTLDEAINRRLALKLEFALPTPEQRVEIWQRMFPKECPLDADIDWERLAIIEISGGYIKNAVLRAARMAATEDVPKDEKRIRMKHLVKALALETQSMIEFDEARKQHAQGYGHAVGNTIQRGPGGIQKSLA